MMVWNIMSRVESVFLVTLFVLSLIAVSSSNDREEDGPDSNARILQAWYTIEINVTVTDDVGRDMAGATIHLVGNASTWLTNDLGYFVIQGLADDVTQYTLYAEKQNYMNGPPVPLPVTGNQSYNVTLTVIGGTILGTVTSQSGPIEGANVTISALRYSADTSLADGTYSLPGIPGGTHSVTANAPGYVSQTKDVSIAAAGAVQVNFLLVSQNGSIAGFVFHAVTSAPLNNSVVSVNLTDRTITVTTGEDGGYAIADLPEGSYFVSASRNGFYPASIGNISVTRGNRTDNVNFTLEEKPTALYGTVKSGAFLLRGANISIEGTALFNLSDSDGEYRIENITEGIYNVTAVLEGYEPATLTGIAITLGDSVNLDIELVALPGAVLRGTVVHSDDPGHTLVNVIVTIKISETEQRSTMTNAFGMFEFTQLVAGNYTLQFVLSGFKPMEVRNVAVQAEGITNQTFYMEPVRKGFEGFIFGFDLAHSMMILALFMTIVILAIAVYLRIRTFQAPESAPAVYDQEDEELAEEEGGGPKANPQEKMDRKAKKGGEE